LTHLVTRSRDQSVSSLPLTLPSGGDGANIRLKRSDIVVTQGTRFSIVVTQPAASHIELMLRKRGLGETGLRIRVKAGGCSGFEYVFGWDRVPQDGDLVYEGPQHVQVFVDPKSARFLDGTVVDYDTSLISRGFILRNPNATTTCGCGASFGM
jgi:iron-sulfur cluster assembly protein